ncbi:hypothetical protein V493_01581 [Pseudogymnoascus sp. VKM F-4281 (FW-2241)]|nr:hypothetical protein V493_01581 [Pseudogymnoascus sp. VKM F-4281 (FW-2241)]
MSQQVCSYHQASAFHRQPASHKTASAFSSSANPNEDWTQMSNLVERRRTQNRIAQRNYRKKLKRRLEDLERRAGSLPASPPQTYTRLKETAPKTTQNTRKQSSSSYSLETPRTTYRQPQYTPPLQANNNLLPLERDRSNTTPLLSYAQYPPSDNPSLYTLYNPPYRLTDNYEYAPMAQPQPDFKPKRDDDPNAFGISYVASAGLDIPPHYDYPFTLPLIHAFDFDVVDNEYFAQYQNELTSYEKLSQSSKLSGKVAIVTGVGSAGDGIVNGRAVAIFLAEQGASVVCVDRHRD